MHLLLENLIQLVIALWDVLTALGAVILPWLPVVAWVVFWLFAVNWVRMRETMLKGGWIPLLLIGFVMVLVWGTVAPPAGGVASLGGLRLSNIVEKTVYVAALFTILFVCGAVQLSGAVDRFLRFEEPQKEEPAHH